MKTKPWTMMMALPLAVMLKVTPMQAQPSELVELKTIVATTGGPTQFTFADHGTGATSYIAEFSPTVGASANWQTAPGAVFTDLGNGQKRVSFGTSAPGFFRVRCVGGTADPIVVNFPNATLEMSEGETSNATVNFSRPYYGTIRYAIGGTAGAGDYQGLTGEVTVNGTTSVVIPISLTDNNTIGQLKQLVLTLQSGSGAVLNAANESTITILDNDAEWKGTFIDADASLGFVLKINKNGGNYTASLVSDGVGLIPVGEYAASITYTANNFTSTTSAIGMDTANTFQNLPAQMTLDLAAANGQSNQSVSTNQINGVASLIVQYPGKSYLNRTNVGTFVLFKPPVDPSTNKVQLVNVQ
ncbi:hypothetical protein GC207_01815 [bacterium]|nr:hypothetical protein [bacterium]